MKNPNPLLRSHRKVHIPLALLSVLFLMPFLWLICASFQTREQIGSAAPEFIPRMTYWINDNIVMPVEHPTPLDVEMAKVEILEGPKTGEKILIETQHIHDLKIKLWERDADQLKKAERAVRCLEVYPVGYMKTRAWSLRKEKSAVDEDIVVSKDELSTRVRPLWENYLEAIRALSAKGDDKSQSIMDLVTHSKLPFIKDREGDTITFITYLANTLVVALLGGLGALLSSSLAAYGLSRLEWRGREGMFSVTLATMMVPFPVVMIPLFEVYKELGWVGTLLPLWVPAWFGGAFNIFLLRQFYKTIPMELSEAARIDGCSEFGIWWRVILPLSRPALAVVGLFYVMYAWNDFLAPLIFLTDQADFTIALGLREYQSQNGGSEWQLLMAASTLLVLPILVLFFCCQKTFIAGISTSGGK